MILLIDDANCGPKYDCHSSDSILCHGHYLCQGRTEQQTWAPRGGHRRTIWWPASVSRSRVACLNWWDVPFESEWDIFTMSVRRNEKSIITRSFFYIPQGWVAVSLLQASSTLDFSQWYVFTLTPISNIRLLWKKNLLGMDTLIWSLCSGTDVFTSDVKNSQTSYHFGHPCWNQCQKCSRFCH